MSDDSEDDVMKTYQQIVNNSMPKNKTLKNDMNTDDDKIEELKEEIKRLRDLVKQYRKESRNITFKCVDMRDREKTSIMQILELLKLNKYLIENIPQSKRLLKKYISDNHRNKDNSSQQMNGYDNAIDDNEDESESEMSEESDDDSDHETYSNRRNKDSIGKRVSSSAVDRNKSQATEEQSDVESIETTSPVKSVGKASNASRSRSRSSSSARVVNEANSRKKSKKKAVKRRRVEPEIGCFPCTFDKNQCTLVLQTKDAFNFHMSGHLEAKFVCPFCAYTGPTIQIIKRHITTEREDNDEMHRKYKIYKCNACLDCHKIHERDEKRCSHILQDKNNCCKFSHDIDHEFKDHLKQHIAETFGKNIKNKDVLRNKIREIANKFVDNQYFQNNAKKRFMIQKYGNKTATESSDFSD